MILGPCQDKTVGADHAARVHGHAIAQHAAMVNRDIGIQNHIIAQYRALPDHHAGMQDAALANHRTGTDADVFAHFAAGGNDGALADHRTGMDAGLRLRRRMEQRCHLGKIQIGVIHHNPGACWVQLCFQLGRNNHRTGGTSVQLLAVLGIGQKGNIGCSRHIHRCQAFDRAVLPLEHTTQAGHDMRKCVRHQK